jgi:hypothetical protein
MTFNGTNVDPDELKAFSKKAHTRAQDTTNAANDVAGVHLGAGMLGFFSQMFLDQASEDQATVVSNLRTMAATLSADGAIATAAADDFTDTNKTQASRFTDKELP